MSVWLIGNRGMLGIEVERLLRQSQIPYLATDKELDIRDPQALAAFAGRRFPQGLRWIVNCAAYTAVDRAEDEPEPAFQINAEGVEHIARLASRIEAQVVHLSTDYVFDGTRADPYTEEDPPAPAGVYARSKLEGERRLQAATPRHYIVRTAWLYSSHGANFLLTMLRLFREKSVVRVVSDQRGSPTYAGDLAGAILRIVTSEGKPYGIYHYTNEGETSWYEFACEIYELATQAGLLSNAVRIEPISTEQYPVKAPRPRHSTLSKDKYRRVFGADIRDWKQALADCLARLKGEACARSAT